MLQDGTGGKDTAVRGSRDRAEFGRQLPGPRRTRYLRNRCRPLAGSLHLKKPRPSSIGRHEGNHLRIFLRRQEEQNYVSSKVPAATRVGIELTPQRPVFAHL